MCDLSQGNDHTDVRQICQPCLEIVPAGSNLTRLRLIGRRQAFDCVEDHRALELQPVAWTGAILARREPELEQRRIEQLAGVVAGEGSAGAVGAVLARRKADDRQPSIAITEGGNRRVPPAGVLVAALL